MTSPKPKMSSSGPSTSTTLTCKLNAEHDTSQQKLPRQSIGELADLLQRMLERREPHRVLDEPSKAAMKGSLFLCSKADLQKITPTRPSDELVQEFGEAINTDGLEDLWYPSSLGAWSYGVITRYVMRYSDVSVPANLLLSAARFGEAQLCGASEEVMYAAFEELTSGRYRSHRQWKELVNPNDQVYEAAAPDFKGDMVRFAPSGPDGSKECLIHELKMAFHARDALRIAFCQTDRSMYQVIGKLQYQAFVKEVDVDDLKHDEMACPICLMDYEAGECDKEKKRGAPLYDCMEDNRQPVELTCGHVFGTTCIEKWLFDNVSCPLCRATLLGADRITKPIDPERLLSITTFAEAEGLLFCEDIDFDQELHEEIAEAIRKRPVAAFVSLEHQFYTMDEIDLRLGTLNNDIPNTASPLAHWMDEDWDIFATNSRTLLNSLRRYFRLHPHLKLDPETKIMIKSLVNMLNVHRQRAQL